MSETAFFGARFHLRTFLLRRKTNMANYSICGIDCDSCKFKVEQGCKGCKTIEGRVFWGECDLYKCNAEKGQEHCGKCAQFPCDTLKEWAASENSERIDNLRNL